MLTRDEWQKMQDEAKVARPNTANEKATLVTIVLLAEICERLHQLEETMKGKHEHS